MTRDAGARVILSGHTYYGCLDGAGRLVALGGDACLGGRTGQVSHPRLAGDTVAYVLLRCGIDTGSAEVISMTLRSRRFLHRASANLMPAGPESFPRVTDLVLRASGAMAWISSTSSIGRHTTSIEVDRVDRGGSAVLDQGPGITTGSLRLSGSRFSWVDGGKRRLSRLR